MRSSNGRSFGRYLLMVGMGTLVATIVVSLSVEMLVRQMAQMGVALCLLLLIILIGIVADAVGTAAAAASREAPFHAKAAKKVFGAQHSVYLVKNRVRVANITQDVISDTVGIIAGALGITLVTQVFLLYPRVDAIVFNVLITAVIAAVIVTGKAYGKRVAVERADEIVFMLGKILAGAGRLRFWRAVSNRHNHRNR